jgi:hypothetical protein
MARVTLSIQVHLPSANVDASVLFISGQGKTIGAKFLSSFDHMQLIKMFKDPMDAVESIPHEIEKLTLGGIYD